MNGEKFTLTTFTDHNLNVRWDYLINNFCWETSRKETMWNFKTDAKHEVLLHIPT